jgi:hypothetical protein
MGTDADVAKVKVELPKQGTVIVRTPGPARSLGEWGCRSERLKSNFVGARQAYIRRYHSPAAPSSG